jgi:hypothetical protein
LRIEIDNRLDEKFRALTAVVEFNNNGKLKREKPQLPGTNSRVRDVFHQLVEQDCRHAGVYF